MASSMARAGSQSIATATRARWYTHGWNREISWRLILGILPKVPRPLRPPLHLAMSTLCFLVMGEERRAARKNLGRVTGARGPAGLTTAWRLFHNYSRFMTAYIDLPPWGDGILEQRISSADAGPTKRDTGSEGGAEERMVGSDVGLEVVRRALSRGRGLILLGMHLGQWDLALIALARAGFKVTVVMRREDDDASRFAEACRRAAGIRVVHAGESPWLFVELRLALQRNEIVAMQGDRDMGGRTLPVILFGKPIRIPAGPWELASLSGTPILPGALLLRGGRGFEMMWGEPIEVGRGDGAEERSGDPARLAGAMESLIRRCPEQWFNFYDVWDGGEDEPAPTAGPGATVDGETSVSIRESSGQHGLSGHR